MRRPLPALELARNPLTAVLAQVVISPVLKMESFLPSIQDDLRKNGFPGYRREDSQEIQIGPTPAVKVATRWLFIDKDNCNAVILTPGAVVLQTSRYEKFEKFTELAKTALGIIGKHAEISLSQRLGLRYVNLIRPEKDKELNHYLQPGLMGLEDHKLTKKKLASRFEFLGETEMGRLLIRLFYSDKGRSLPPDLDDLRLIHEKSKPGERTAILDIDHFSIKQRDYSPESLVSDFWNLHEYTDRAFRESVTPAALEDWKLGA